MGYLRYGKNRRRISEMLLVSDSLHPAALTEHGSINEWAEEWPLTIAGSRV